MPAESAPDTVIRDRQRLYGLIVAADQDLHQGRPAGDASPDVLVCSGVVVAPESGRPSGDVLVDFGKADRQGTFAVRRADGSYLLRFSGSAEFEISADLREVVVHPVVGGVNGIATVLTTGGMLAFQLYVRGSLVLHASAVDIGSAAVAFTGHQGMGKSTMAALMCAAGARLITDDVLRVDLEAADNGDRIARTRLGATGIRLRKGADTLAAAFATGGCVTEASADCRQVLQLADDATDGLPLRAVVVPFPDRSIRTLRVRRLNRKRALLAMLGFPRIPGWEDDNVVSRQFHGLAELVSTVPVVGVTVPWGPPFPRDLASELLATLECDGPPSSD